MKWYQKIWYAIFPKKNEAPSTPSQPTQPTTPTTPVEPKPPVVLPPSGKRPRIAICRGHGGNDSGAVGNGTSEVKYNTAVMKYIEENTGDNVRCFYGSSSVDAVKQSLDFNPDITIQLHLNSFNKTAHGCEVLVIKGDTKSYGIAENFAEAFTKHFGRTKRRPEANGKKILDSSDRGVTSLKAVRNGTRILVEPFFIDNPDDFVPGEKYQVFFVNFLENLS